MKKTFVSGRLIADAHVHEYTDGKFIVSFPLAWRKQKNDDDRDNIINVSMFLNSPNVAELLLKGTTVSAEGRIEIDAWEKDGVVYHRQNLNVFSNYDLHVHTFQNGDNDGRREKVTKNGGIRGTIPKGDDGLPATAPDDDPIGDYDDVI